MSQESEILRRLTNGETLTPIEALADPGIRSFRLAARIDSLRKDGHDIETVPIHTGTGRTVAGYRIRRRIEQGGQAILTKGSHAND
jgi:hypothetical protein